MVCPINSVSCFLSRAFFSQSRQQIPGIGEGIAARIAAYLAGEVYNVRMCLVSRNKCVILTLTFFAFPQPDSRHAVTEKVEQDIESKLLAMKRLQVIPGIG